MKNLYYRYKKTSLLVLLSLTSVVAGLIIARLGLIPGVLTLILLIAIPSVYVIIAFPKIGVMVLLIISYLMVTVARLGVNFPLGTILDGLQVLLIISFLLVQKYKPDWTIYKNSTSYIIVVWIFYNIIEVANPVAESRLAWLYTIRTIAIVTLTYFVFMRFVDSVKFIRVIIKVWLVLSIIGALYALKQEFLGFSAAEQKWLDSDPRLTQLYFIDGHWRKFSIFTDPVSFAYNMVVSSILCICLITGPLLTWKKVVLGILSLLFIVAMLFSGTRGAYVLIPVAFVLFCILKFNKKILIVAVVVGAMIGTLIFMPSSNPVIVRFQSAFQPSDDPSFNVRKSNQKRIQPYILTHPMGGGLGATGAWGERFSPNSYLANFPPDSGYVRVAVEQGWIGLLIFCIFIFIVLSTGIKHFYKIRDPELKSYCLAMISIIFALNIGNYPQEALVQYPTNVYFYLCIALIHITYLLDKKKETTLINAL